MLGELRYKKVCIVEYGGSEEGEDIRVLELFPLQRLRNLSLRNGLSPSKFLIYGSNEPLSPISSTDCKALMLPA